MLMIKKKYEVKLNTETIKNIDYWIKEIQNGHRPQDLKNYISKLAKACFDKGLKEGEGN